MFNQNLTSWPTFLRITSISVGAYDYLLTLPAEYKFYCTRTTPSTERRLRFSLSGLLFFLIRYTSIAAIALNNAGFFIESWSAEDCRKYYLAAPAMKVVQSMISQTIMGLRAYSIAGRSRHVGIFLLVFGTLVSGLEWFGSIYGREMVQIDVRQASDIAYLRSVILTRVPAARHPILLRDYVWIFYAAVIGYDLVTMGIATFYLMRVWSGAWRVSSFMKMLLFDGILYFWLLTGANILNIFVYRIKDQAVQSSAAPFGYCVTWMMSQKILIHIQNSAFERSQNPVVITQQGSSAHAAGHIRSLITSTKHPSQGTTEQDDMVQVRIERSVLHDVKFHMDVDIERDSIGDRRKGRQMS